MTGRRPYVVGVASHKGGTGRSTTVAALGWALSSLGQRVGLVDSNPTPSLSLLVEPNEWPGVRMLTEVELSDTLDVVLIDCPPLTERASQRTLRHADGILVTILADPLSLRTLPRSVEALQDARQSGSKLDLLGVLISNYAADDPLQAVVAERLRAAYGDVLAEPFIPESKQLRNWALVPGSALTPGPTQQAFTELAKQLVALREVAERDRVAMDQPPPNSSASGVRRAVSMSESETAPTPKGAPRPAEQGPLRGLLNVVRKITGRMRPDTESQHV